MPKEHQDSWIESQCRHKSKLSEGHCFDNIPNFYVDDLNRYYE